MTSRSFSVEARMITPPATRSSSGDCAIGRQPSSPEKEQAAQQNEIEGEMPGEAKILAGVAEAAATDIEAARFRHDRGDDEDGHEHRENKHSAAIQHARDQGHPAKDFEPGQIKRQP